MAKLINIVLLLTVVTFGFMPNAEAAPQKQYIDINGTQYLKCQPVADYRPEPSRSNGLKNGSSGADWWLIKMSPVSTWNEDSEGMCASPADNLLFMGNTPKYHDLCNNPIVKFRYIGRITYVAPAPQAYVAPVSTYVAPAPVSAYVAPAEACTESLWGGCVQDKPRVEMQQVSIDTHASREAGREQAFKHGLQRDLASNLTRGVFGLAIADKLNDRITKTVVNNTTETIVNNIPGTNTPRDENDGGTSDPNDGGNTDGGTRDENDGGTSADPDGGNSGDDGSHDTGGGRGEADGGSSGGNG